MISMHCVIKMRQPHYLGDSYEIGLQWVCDDITLPNNHEIAVMCLNILGKGLMISPELLPTYQQYINEMLYTGRR